MLELEQETLQLEVEDRQVLQAREQVQEVLLLITALHRVVELELGQVLLQVTMVPPMLREVVQELVKEAPQEVVAQQVVQEAAQVQAQEVRMADKPRQVVRARDLGVRRLMVAGTHKVLVVDRVQEVLLLGATQALGELRRVPQDV